MIKQKYTAGTNYHEYRYTHSKQLMTDIKALNVYQLNIFQVLQLIHIAKNKASPINHNDLTLFSKTSFKQPKIIAKATSFTIFSRGLYLWNNYLDHSEVSVRNNTK